MPSSLQLIVYDRFREQSRYTWDGSRLLIGRRADADIRVDEPTMSAIHAEINGDGDVLRVRDLESLNGTQLNGERIQESPLTPGDEIQIGRARIVLDRIDSQKDRPSDEGPLAAPLTVGSQTVKIKLATLRGSDLEPGREDPRILLLADLFEALRSVDDRNQVLEQTRPVLQQAFPRARIFVLMADAEQGWHDPQIVDLSRPPSLTFVQEAAHSDSAILSTSLPEDQRFSTSESARISGIETAMAAPARCDGHAVAVFYVDRLGLPAFMLPDLNLLAIASNHVSAVLENVSRIADLRRTNAELVEARETLAMLNRNLEAVVEERTAEIRRQADEIAELAEAKDELLGIAAHDIRGPLTVIQGTSELLRLRAGKVAPETLERSLDLMHGAARGLSQLLGELLDAKAIENGKLRLQRLATPLEHLFAEVLPVPKLAADDKKIEVVTRTEPDLRADVDPQRLGQALTNLLLNAVKFSEPGSRIVLHGRGAADRLEIEVEDRGVGIPEDELDQIFGTFEQGLAGRQFGGSGLGLMIARRLVELHDGELRVESEVGVGSRFIMSLPRAGGIDQND
ncbi:MAG: ATP-binding protein [Acidobacteriota bacterium]